MENPILRDLKDIIEVSSAKYRSEYTPDEVELTDDFKTLFKKDLNAAGYDIEYYKYTSRVVSNTKSGMYIYFPNQWYVIASYFVDLYNELARYQDYYIKTAILFESKFEDSYRFKFGKQSQKYEKTLAEILKNCSEKPGENDDLKADFQICAEVVFRSDGYSGDAMIADAADKLTRCVTDYKSWSGLSSQKTIDRTSDFYISVILNNMNVVNASQEFAARITAFYAQDRELQEMVSSGKMISGVIKTVGSSSPESAIHKDGRNLIVYGTPGCGKSFYVKNTILNGREDNVIRTTFYQDYTNTDFIGQILPEIHEDKSVTYEFNPGPFTQALEKALSNTKDKIALVIEEINRGNAASIFGDVFQLLDREKDTGSPNCGKSIYAVNNKYIQDYLRKHNISINKVSIPSNMSIYATMNTSDQNVFTLDTAFKRRWDFKKLPNEFTEEHEYADYFIPGMKGVTWRKFVTEINRYIVGCDDLFKSEDKLVGVYFVDSSCLCRLPEEDTYDKKRDFSYKVFEYLWDDVFRNNHDYIFRQDIKTLDSLLTEYLGEGGMVFARDFLKTLEPDITYTDRKSDEQNPEP